jgi:hypothetical protein
MLQRRVFRREPDISQEHIAFIWKGEARDYEKKAAILNSYRTPDVEREQVL